MDAPFLEGVNYFSRAEEAAARFRATQRQDTTSVGAIHIRAEDTVSLDLMRRLREEVNGWKNRATVRPDQNVMGHELTTHLQPEPDFLNFAASSSAQALHPERGLNSFQRRLVHQYIQTEHPDLVTITRPGFIQIVPYDREREDAQQKSRARMFEEKLTRQIGLRWPIEAICGGDLSAINSHSFFTTQKARQEKIAADFVQVREQLKGNSTVLAGHNLFLDLIYFYACFFGPLPDQVEDFQRTIHELFPRIIDTKYLATHNVEHPALARSSLEELEERLSMQEEPVIGTRVFGQKESKY